MSEKERTPVQTLEEANAFLEKAGVMSALEEFLNSDRVKSTVDHYAKQCEKEIRELVNSQKEELIAKAEVAVVCDGIVKAFHQDFPANFRIFMFLDHVEILRAYGVEEQTIFAMISNVLTNNSEILHQLVNSVCSIQCDKYYYDACERLESQDSEEENEPEQPVTSETCGEIKCLYEGDCKERGVCLKGQEFHCNGKGTEGCNCPGSYMCNPGAGRYPCVDLDFIVIPPKGGCCESGVN